jgi:hypothetical protein
VLAKSKFVTELPRIMNSQQTPGGQNDLDAALQELRTYGQRMEELGRLFQDPASVTRIYFAPEEHMEQAEASGQPIILDSADYLGFLAVEVLQHKLDRLRQLGAAPGRAPSG